jgi:DNA-directed RNA polymerase subunit RPC12/RpoP
MVEYKCPKCKSEDVAPDGYVVSHSAGPEETNKDGVSWWCLSCDESFLFEEMRKKDEC